MKRTARPAAPIGERGGEDMPTDHSLRIQSLERADAILAAIAHSPDGCARLIDIAAGTGLHKNTVFSLLQTLVALGYCERSKERAYRIGRRTFELARVAERNIDLVTLVRPVMLRLVW